MYSFVLKFLMEIKQTLFIQNRNFLSVLRTTTKITYRLTQNIVDAKVFQLH